MTEFAERVMVLWVPDWPVHAYLREREEGHAPGADRALALIAQHRVVACSPEARVAGVRVGIREREARMCCPTLDVHPYDEQGTARAFAPVLAAIEQTIPGVELLRPGLCAMRARGPARYYGGEEAAAATLTALATELGFPEARVGIASGRFAAEHAARASTADPEVVAPSPRVRIIPAESTVAFLSHLPVARAASPELAEVLTRLGIRTLGALAALPEDAVRQRFSAAGVAAHRRARGLGAAHAAEVHPHTPDRDLARTVDFEPPLDGADQLAFACSTHAEAFIQQCIELGLVCTELRIELTDDIGTRHERVWAHPSHFTAADVVNRVRWQAGALPRVPERGGSGIARVLLTPVRTARAAQHEPGLWNSAPDERVHHHLSRVQSLVGHDGVGTGEILGGRLSAERQRLVPWGTRSATAPASRTQPRVRDGPWPGRLTGAAPDTVFSVAPSAELLDHAGVTVHPDSEDLLTADPARLSIEGLLRFTEVAAWSAPWPLRERWWRSGTTCHRLQVVLSDGDAWLLRYEANAAPPDTSPTTGRWVAEARYT